MSKDIPEKSDVLKLIELLEDAETSNASIITALDPTDKYSIADSDTSANPAYHGFLDKDGNWYILKIDSSAGTYRYCSGLAASAYATNWTGRAALTYVVFNSAF